MEKLKEKLDFKKLNEAIGTGNKILKLLYTLLIIVVVYSLTMLVKEWGILKIFLSVLSVLSPFFIGYVLAWLLNPVVNKLEDKGLKRTLSVFLNEVSSIFSKIGLRAISASIAILRIFSENIFYLS